MPLTNYKVLSLKAFTLSLPNYIVKANLRDMKDHCFRTEGPETHRE